MGSWHWEWYGAGAPTSTLSLGCLLLPSQKWTLLVLPSHYCTTTHAHSLQGCVEQPWQDSKRLAISPGPTLFQSRHVGALPLMCSSLTQVHRVPWDQHRVYPLMLLVSTKQFQRYLHFEKPAQPASVGQDPDFFGKSEGELATCLMSRNYLHLANVCNLRGNDSFLRGSGGTGESDILGS
uniref:Uncharacterized protein n=1 Tax=Chlorocebus sabaeus TaxID=60711 RepID=A0A0D9S0T7_CHLSB